MELKPLMRPGGDQSHLMDNSDHSLTVVGQPPIFMISLPEADLERSATQRAMSWLPTLYDASGLTHSMSRECFMVNALAKIKEAIWNEENRLTCLKFANDLSEINLNANKQSTGRQAVMKAANYLLSGTLLLGTLLYKLANSKPIIAVGYPAAIPIHSVQGSCARMALVLNKTWGMDSYKACWQESQAFDVPCNATNLGNVETSFCCWKRFDPLCNEVIVEYMNTTYPQLASEAVNRYYTLKNRALLATSLPFYMVVPTVITVQILLQLAGYKYRRIMRERDAFIRRRDALVQEVEMADRIEGNA